LSRSAYTQAVQLSDRNRHDPALAFHDEVSIRELKWFRSAASPESRSIPVEDNVCLLGIRCRVSLLRLGQVEPE
jgi:hypothetical protein